MAEEWTTKKVDKYVLVNKKLGSGAYGTVYRGFFAEDESRQVAVKTIPIKLIQDSQKMLELIKREIAILQKINHPNIVRLYDVARTSNYLYMFLEYCQDGDLKEYMIKKEEKRLSELEAVIFLKHIVEGFKKLYSLKIIHRDIKPANILLHNGVAKITDFGFARMIETEMNDPAYLSRLGSPLYMAPQILEGQPFSAKCDVWSVGILFFELLYGKTPWTGENQFNLLDNIKKQPLKFPTKPVRSQKVKELITQMLKISEKERLSWEDVFKNATIKIEESKIKQNFDTIIKEKDSFSKSISMNKLYMDQHLVVGYLAQNPNEQNETLSNTSDKSDDIKRFSQQHLSQYDGESNGDIIMNNYKNEKKKRDALMKYNNYFLFERNIAFFFNFVIQKLISLYNEKFISLEVDNYFRILYLIVKNQLIHLERVNKQLGMKKQENFDNDSWGKYQASSEYAKIRQLIDLDLKHTKEFFEEISKKTQEVQKMLMEGAKADSITVKFMMVLNNNFDATDQFHQIYRAVIQENLLNLKRNQTNPKQSLLMVLYFAICLNPYDEFKDIAIDFHNFYESNENLSEQELTEKINVKLQIQ